MSLDVRHCRAQPPRCIRGGVPNILHGSRFAREPNLHHREARISRVVARIEQQGRDRTIRQWFGP